MPTFSAYLRACSLVSLSVIASSCTPQQDEPESAMAPVERGRYLVALGGCNDCHSPKVFTDKGAVPDEARSLSGHPSDANLPAIPGGLFGPNRWGALASPHLTAWACPWGVSFSANLTPHRTGLGAWRVEQFIEAMRTGKHMGVGRQILPPMPWFDIGKLTDEDLRAIFAYLKSLKPVANIVPAPLPPEQRAD